MDKQSEKTEKSIKKVINKINEFILNKYDILDLGNLQLTMLPNNFAEMVPNLESLYCHSNELKELPVLPSKLVQLECQDNQLVKLQNIPLSLEYLNCANNQIKELPNLPSNLSTL